MTQLYFWHDEKTFKQDLKLAFKHIGYQLAFQTSWESLQIKNILTLVTYARKFSVTVLVLNMLQRLEIIRIRSFWGKTTGPVSMSAELCGGLCPFWDESKVGKNSSMKDMWPEDVRSMGRSMKKSKNWLQKWLRRLKFNWYLRRCLQTVTSIGLHSVLVSQKLLT